MSLLEKMIVRTSLLRKNIIFAKRFHWMTLKERYKRFKAWQLEPFDWSYDENERHHCVNCGYDFVGKFCPHCSQKAGLKKISWKSVLQSTAEVWGMGNRSLLYSLWQLIWRPGYFISDYINGKRQVSFPPYHVAIMHCSRGLSCSDHVAIMHYSLG